MLSLLNEIHFFTSQEDVTIKATDYGCFKYYTAKKCDDTPYLESKKSYADKRGILWTLNNKRPYKLKERLKEFEEYLVSNKVISFAWDRENLQLLLSTGLLVQIIFNINSGDLISITFNKHLASKLQVNIICDGFISGQQVLCICNDGHVLGFNQWKDCWVLEGGPRRKLNYFNEWLVVWGKASSEQPQPWSPLAKDHQRANLHLYWVGARGPELLAYKKTEDEPLDVIVSKHSPKNLIVIEQKVSQRGTVSVEVNVLELAGNNLKRISMTSVPLVNHVSCCKLSDDEDKLLIGCVDGSLALLDRTRGSTKTVRASFIPKFAAWHNLGALFVICSDKGQLQYFDTALNPIKFQLISEDLSPMVLLDLSEYVSIQFNVSSISWGLRDLIVILEQGPMVLLKHTESSLNIGGIVQNYLFNKEIDKAISLILSIEFNEQIYVALQNIVSYLLRLPMTSENAKHLQNALGSFHNPPVPMSDQIRRQFIDQVCSLTRRYFHHLVRAKMFETAFLLAVDLGHHDLFMDLHYIAIRVGETEMATATKAQASALLSCYSSETSDCSRSSCSQCSSSASSSEYNSENEDQVYTNNKTLQNNPNTSVSVDNLVNIKIFNPTNPTSGFTRPPDNNRQILNRQLQGPINLSKSVSSLLPPPLPSYTTYTPPLPNLNKPSIPCAHHTKVNIYNNPVRTCSIPSLIPPPSRLSQPMSFKTQNSNFTSDSMFSALSSSNMSVNNIKTSFMPLTKIVPPPLPVASLMPPGAVPPHGQAPSGLSVSNYPSSSKRQPSKVKFSDTVTAFIVPEVKRPVRPVPHTATYVTNPQKELADSLPLCHPNEDYLKDFAPVRKNDDKAESETQSKIKVVHFGVV